MANSFSKEEKVAFDNMLEGFNDALVLSRAVSRLSSDPVSMERAGDILWRPQPYIARSFDGMDQSSNFGDVTQLSVPATLGYSKAVPWVLDAKELRDALQAGNLKEAADQKLASDINVAVSTVAGLQGTLVVKRLTTDTAGFEDLAAADALMNEQGIPMGDRHVALSSRDYNAMAANLANRGTMAGKPTTAYEQAKIGDNLAGFTAWKLDYAPRLAAKAGVTVTINDATAADRRHVPLATSTAATGEKSNVDNRTMPLTIAVTSGTVKVGDSFTIAGCYAVHHITKQSTGQLKTFRITGIVSGAGGSGVVTISPPIIVADGSTEAEKRYANVDTTPADGAAITFLNTAEAAQNPFWHKSAIELIPGRYAVPTDAGAAVMRATTDQGVELVLSKFFDINTLKTKFRADVFFGVCMVQPEMAGVLLRGQS